MDETPREYKKRVDETREKRRKNRDKLFEYLEEYELVDEKYKVKTKEEILANFDENEKIEKSTELYVKIGQELGSIEKKYKELEELKIKLDSRRQKISDLRKQMVNQNVNGTDKTTLKLQMQNLLNIKEESKTIEEEIKNLEDEVSNREREIKEIEETYGKKEDIEQIKQENEDQKEEKEQETETHLDEKPIKENPETLQEYKEKVLSERGRIDEIKGSIIDLLEEGIGIDDTMKDRIKSKILSTFNEYEAKQEGSLRMKSARYLEDRKGVLEEMGYGKERESRTIGGKQLIKGKKSDGKYYITWGKQQIGDDFNYVCNLEEIGGKPCFQAKKDGIGVIVMWGDKQVGKGYELITLLQEIGGKPAFIAEKNGKKCVMRGDEQQGDWYDAARNLQAISGRPAYIAKNDGKSCIVRGGKVYSDKYDVINDLEGIGGEPAFKAEKNGESFVMRLKYKIDGFKKFVIGGKPVYKVELNGKYCVIQGDKINMDWYDTVCDLKEIGGKPAFIAEKDRKRCVMRGNEQQGKWYDFVDDLQEIGGKPTYIAKRDGKYCVMQGKKQLLNWYKCIGCLQEIGGKPCFHVKNDYWKRCVIRGNKQQCVWFENVGVPVEIGGKPCFIAVINGKVCIIRGNEQVCDWTDSVGDPIDVGGKPCFKIEKSYKEYIMWGNDQLGDRFYEVQNPINVGGKPCFVAEKVGKCCVMRGNEQQGYWFDEVDRLQEVGGKPLFCAKLYCALNYGDDRRLMRGNEQIGNLFSTRYKSNKIEDFINDYNGNQQEITKETNDSAKTVEEEKPENEKKEIIPSHRENREKIILERYQKKLNRDELLKIITGIESIDGETKKTLKLEIFSDFYTEFKKTISDTEYQGWDKEYRELKKAERQIVKKHAEWDLLKEKNTPEIVELDEKLFEIANSAMELENGSRWNNRGLKKAQSERDILSEKQKKILKDLKKIKKEAEGIGPAIDIQTKKYGKKSVRLKIKGVSLKKYKGAEEKLKLEKTLKGHKEVYIKIIEEKEEYTKDLVNQIETTDFGISEGKKKEVIEKLKIAFEKDLEEFKKGDDILKIAEETEKWLEENKESHQKMMEELEKKIEEKNTDIENLKIEVEGKSIDEIFEIKQHELKLNEELINLKEEYEKIKSEWEEKLEKYQGKE